MVVVVAGLVVVVLVSHPLQVLSHSPGSFAHKFMARNPLQYSSEFLLCLFAHRSVVVVVAVVVSQPLHVLSHSPGTFAHKSMETKRVHCATDFLLNLFAHVSVVVVVLVVVVVVLVVIALTSHPLHALSQKAPISVSQRFL